MGLGRSVGQGKKCEKKKSQPGFVVFFRQALGAPTGSSDWNLSSNKSTPNPRERIMLPLTNTLRGLLVGLAPRANDLRLNLGCVVEMLELKEGYTGGAHARQDCRERLRPINTKGIAQDLT